MSFPDLLLTGNLTNRSISDIGITYLNDTATPKPAKITRAKYDIKREYKTLNVSGGTPTRYPDLPYNAVRFVHTWVGYIDVRTGSVGIYATSTAAEIKNMNLIKTATIYTGTNGVDFTLPVPAAQGPNNPSLAQTYNPAYEAGRDWVYKIDSDGGTPPTYTKEKTPFWNILDINILDNQNGTSRVTFSFGFKEEWLNTAEIIDANTP